VRLFFTHDPDCAMAELTRDASGRYGTVMPQAELVAFALAA